MRKRNRRGYTLFSLLILLALALLLLGMLFPAMHKVQIASKRMQSQNNIKQIGIALHNYNDVNGRLPSGVDGNGYSALTHLLPFIEQDNLYRILQPSLMTTTADKAPGGVRVAYIKVYVSPLDPVRQPDMKSGPTNYMMVAGSKANLAGNDGILYKESRTRFTDISDGTSNTIMTLETLKGDGKTKAEAVARQHVRLKKADLKGLKDEAGVKDFENSKNIVGNRGGAWIEGRFLQATTTVTREFNSTKPDVDCEGEGGLAAPRSLETGTNVGMADGSARWISNKVTLSVWQAVATRAGGEVVNLD